jgi:hypothetical protein
LFEAIEIINQALVRNLIKFLDEYKSRKIIFAYVKDEGSNMNAMTIILKFIMICECMGLEESFQGSYFDKGFSKAC